MIGKTILHYKILEKLCSAGLGYRRFINLLDKQC